MDSRQNLLNSVSDAITASGKKFSEIKKDAIFSFFSQEGVPKSSWEDLYNRLRLMYQTPAAKNVDKNKQSAVVDYSNTSHNDVKVRQPRKSVFSDIKKIAG